MGSENHCEFIGIDQFHQPNCGGPWVFRSNMLTCPPFTSYRSNIEVEQWLRERRVLPSPWRYTSSTTGTELVLSFQCKQQASDFGASLTHTIRKAHRHGEGESPSLVLWMLRRLFLFMRSIARTIKRQSGYLR